MCHCSKKLMRVFNLLFLFVNLLCVACANSEMQTDDDSAHSQSETQKTDSDVEFIMPISKAKYSASCENLCDDEHGILLDMDTMSKYGRYNPYHISDISSGDSTIIQFDFITDCCATFTGEVGLEKDTLYLGYYYDRDTMSLCDCYCDYRMTYRINKSDLKWSALKIVHGKPRKN